MMLVQPPTIAYFREDFNRSNSSSLGSDWRTDSGSASAQVLSNDAEAKTMSSNTGRNGNWHSYSDATTLRGNGGKLLTDNYKVRAQLKQPQIANATGPNSNLATDEGASIRLAVPDTASSSTIECYFGTSTGSGSAIWTQTNAPSSPYAAISQTGQTQRATASSPSNGTVTSLIEIERRKTGAHAVFKAWIDGVNCATWTDSSDLVPSGSTNRRWGFIVEGNYPIFQTQFNAPAFDWIEAFDLYV